MSIIRAIADSFFPPRGEMPTPSTNWVNVARISVDYHDRRLPEWQRIGDAGACKGAIAAAKAAAGGCDSLAIIDVMARSLEDQYKSRKLRRRPDDVDFYLEWANERAA